MSTKPQVAESTTAPVGSNTHGVSHWNWLINLQNAPTGETKQSNDEGSGWATGTGFLWTYDAATILAEDAAADVSSSGWATGTDFDWKRIAAAILAEDAAADAASATSKGDDNNWSWGLCVFFYYLFKVRCLIQSRICSLTQTWRPLFYCSGLPMKVPECTATSLCAICTL